MRRHPQRRQKVLHLDTGLSLNILQPVEDSASETCLPPGTESQCTYV